MTTTDQIIAAITATDGWLREYRIDPERTVRGFAQEIVNRAAKKAVGSHVYLFQEVSPKMLASPHLTKLVGSTDGRVFFYANDASPSGSTGVRAAAAALGYLGVAVVIGSKVAVGVDIDMDAIRKAVQS